MRASTQQESRFQNDEQFMRTHCTKKSKTLKAHRVVSGVGYVMLHRMNQSGRCSHDCAPLEEWTTGPEEQRL
jgi:hypothetical protein